jgi:hypothetical protein
MFHSCFALASAALVVATFSPARASSWAKDDSSAARARVAFQRIEESSANLEVVADRLQFLAKGLDSDADAHLADLNAVRDDINAIGAQLRSLDEERTSLAPWEAEALDRVLPSMNDAASDARKALEVFNSSKSHLWTTSYSDDIEGIYKDAAQVKKTLKNYLALARVRDDERRLEHDMGNPAGY